MYDELAPTLKNGAACNVPKAFPGEEVENDMLEQVDIRMDLERAVSSSKSRL